MPQSVGGRVVVRRWLAAFVAATMLVAAMVWGCGCSRRGDAGTDDDIAASFDVSSLRWEPERLASVVPALVGWAEGAGGKAGRLIVLAGETDSEAIWEAPASAPVDVRIEEVDPAGIQMLGYAAEMCGDTLVQHDLVFRPDGTVDEVPIPEDYDALLDAGFLRDGLLVLAYHATNEEFSTSLGVVGSTNGWRDVMIEGDLPEYQFVESLAVLPGTNTVALVLKLAGGTGHRDDDALVLAELEDDTLRVTSDAYWDDALPGCDALWDGTGVMVGRTWSETDDGSSAFVRVEWTQGAWTEQVITAAPEVPVPLERGGVMAQDASGGYWFRRVSPDAAAASELVRVEAIGEAAESTGIDVTQVMWFAWVEGQTP